jgi:Cellulase (glycosyl hydrolase family 5)
MHRLVLVAVLLAAVWAESAYATPAVKYGIQDDNYILNGPGKLGQRLDTIDKLGVDVVRYTLRWDEIERRQGRLNWGRTDQVLRGLNNRRIQAIVTLVGTPGWANGGRPSRFAPPSGKDFATFAGTAAERYPFVRYWLIWNEPNLRRWLEPTVPGTYVRRLLNPAFKAIHAANRRALVGGGVTGPRANVGGVSPLDWLRGMRKAGARLDAYAHHPHPGSPFESPTEGGCFGARCKTVTLANLRSLVDAVRRAWGGGKRIWLTEWGYQTKPPDRFLGVSPRLQAQYIGEAAKLVYRTRQVDMLIQFLYQDEPQLDRFQSGLLTWRGRPKPGLHAFSFPIACTPPNGSATRIWGQIRPRAGRQPYRLQRVLKGNRKVWLTGIRLTDRRGIFQASVAVPFGAVVRVWSVRDRRYGAPVTVE